jgi:predicted NBD/HSP70 family sugar kinase
VQELIKRKIFVEGGKRDSSSGRKPSVFNLNPTIGYVIGAELLLNSIRISVLNFNHEVVHEFKSDKFDISQQDAAYRYLVKKIPEIILQAKIPKIKIVGVGIAITGRVNMKSGISYTYLHKFMPLAKLLEKEWGLPVYIDNDTRLMALGEKRYGMAQGKADVIFVNLSQGLGIGIISNGLIHGGHSGFAGEFGHIHAANNDRICVCGKKGCLETIVSGLALEDIYKEKFKQTLPYEQILAKLATGDKAVKKILSTMGEQLGNALGTVVDIFNPEVIVMGGSFASVAEFMKHPIIKGFSMQGLPQLIADCDVKISTIGEQAVMLGTFSLVTENSFK